MRMNKKRDGCMMVQRMIYLLLHQQEHALYLIIYTVCVLPLQTSTQKRSMDLMDTQSWIMCDHYGQVGIGSFSATCGARFKRLRAA